MNSFLERVVILETRLPSHKAYQNCLMDVFTSFLTLTGYAHKYIELGRFSKCLYFEVVIKLRLCSHDMQRNGSPI